MTLLGSLGAFETSPDGDWEFVSVNFLNLLGGLPASSLLGREWISRIHPEDMRRAVAEYRQAREYRRPWTQRLRFLDIDEMPIWVSVNAYPMPTGTDVSGVSFIGIVKDITSEMRAQQLAQQAALTFTELADFYAEGLVIIRDGHIIEANAAAGRIHGCDRGELVGRSVASLIAPGDEAKFAPDGRAEIFMTGDMLRVSDGQRVTIAVHGRPITYSGAPARVASFVPIDDPRIQAASDERSHRRLQALESLLDVAYHRISAEPETLGLIEFCNEHFAAMLGHQPDALIGANFLDLTLPAEREESRRNIAKFTESTGFPRLVRRTLLHADGSSVALQLRVSTYRDPITGHVVAMALSRPVTDPPEIPID